MNDHFIFSSESVGEGHPDKVADFISDSILDTCLAQDPHSRVACETLVKSNCVVLAGEITTKAEVNFEAIVRQAIREIGYINKEDIFHADHVFIHNLLTEQSPDIAQGVDDAAAEGKTTAEQGAGDQGIMFGYACDQTEQLMPAPVMWAHLIMAKLAEERKSGRQDWLRPDSKAQVGVRYENGIPVHIDNVVVSTQHAVGASLRQTIRPFIETLVKSILPKELIDEKTEFHINPTGKFEIGGPQGDSGLTGRKIIVDTYGGWARHGGGAFSGKDPSKVDRSAAYYMRWVAKNIVAAGFASSVELQVSYAIGHPEPTSIHIETFGTEKYPVSKILNAVKKVFCFKPAAMIQELDLKRPIYRESTFYGHFGKPMLPWEQTNRVSDLKKHI